VRVPVPVPVHVPVGAAGVRGIATSMPQPTSSVNRAWGASCIQLCVLTHEASAQRHSAMQTRTAGVPAGHPFPPRRTATHARSPSVVVQRLRHGRSSSVSYAHKHALCSMSTADGERCVAPGVVVASAAVRRVCVSGRVVRAGGECVVRCVAQVDGVVRGSWLALMVLRELSGARALSMMYPGASSLLHHRCPLCFVSAARSKHAEV
jgi:hypothetical protein